MSGITEQYLNSTQNQELDNLIHIIGDILCKDTIESIISKILKIFNSNNILNPLHKHL